MKLAWIDLETTGLNPSFDLILAYGVRITDEKLNLITEAELVIGHTDEAIASRNVSPYVQEMHTKNGLWEKVRQSVHTEADAGRDLYACLERHLAGEKGILAGNSVHFDRSFIWEVWPKVLDLLSHRHLDVSVFKVLQGVWGLPDFGGGKEAAHTPLADLDASMAHFLAVQSFIRANGAVCK